MNLKFLMISMWFKHTLSVERLGRTGIDEIKKHAFFKNESWTWENIRNSIQLISFINITKTINYKISK